MNDTNISTKTNPSNLMIEESDLVKLCLYKPNGRVEKVFNCSDLASVVTSMQEGHKCFTYFSDIYGQMSELRASEKRKIYEMKYENYPSIIFRFSKKYLPHDSLYRADIVLNRQTDQTSGVFIVIHSPTILPHMVQLSLHPLTVSNVIQVNFIKMVEYLQKWPYDTNCDENYITRRKHWKHRNTIDKALSRGDCFLECLWPRLRNRNCINFFTIFTDKLVQREYHDQHLLRNPQKCMNNVTDADYTPNIPSMRFCAHTDHEYQLYTTQRKRCMEICRPACCVEDYRIESFWEMGTDDTFDGDSLVNIQWSDQPVVIVKHKPRFQISQLLGNIGGHAHIWLGLSVPFAIRYCLNLINSDIYMPKLRRLWTNTEN